MSFSTFHPMLSVNGKMAAGVRGLAMPSKRVCEKRGTCQQIAQRILSLSNELAGAQ